MNEGQIWTVIESLDWSGVRDAHEAIDVRQAKLRAENSQLDIIAVERFVDQRIGRLYTALGEWEATNGRLGNYSGDDSLCDLIAHAVGMGRKYFSQAMADPSILDHLDYQENFVYVFLE
jgi:hypothetical protein